MIYYLYAYLLGVILVLLLLVLVKWLRPLRNELFWTFWVPLLFSWITVIIIVVVICKSWKEERDIIRNLPNENDDEPDIEFPGGQIKED